MDKKKLLPEYKFWRALFDITDDMREMVYSDDLKCAETLNFRHHQIMRTVFRMTETRPEGIQLKELAEAIELTPGTVSELVETLVKINALQRVQNPNDRRSVMITLTQMSIDYIEAGLGRTNALSVKLLSSFSNEEREQLVKALGQIQKIINDMKDKR